MEKIIPNVYLTADMLFITLPPVDKIRMEFKHLSIHGAPVITKYRETVDYRFIPLCLVPLSRILNDRQIKAFAKRVYKSLLALVNSEDAFIFNWKDYEVLHMNKNSLILVDKLSGEYVYIGRYTLNHLEENLHIVRHEVKQHPRSIYNYIDWIKLI